MWRGRAPSPSFGGVALRRRACRDEESSRPAWRRTGRGIVFSLSFPFLAAARWARIIAGTHRVFPRLTRPGALSPELLLAACALPSSWLAEWRGGRDAFGGTAGPRRLPAAAAWRRRLAADGVRPGVWRGLGGRAASRQARRRGGGLSCRRRRDGSRHGARPGCAVGRGFVPTLSSNSSIRRPSVSLHAVGLNFGDDHAVDLVAREHRLALFPATSRRNAVLLPSITSVPVSANWPRCSRPAVASGAAGGRTPGGIEERSLHHLRAGPPGRPDDQYSGNSDATTGFGAIGSAGAGCRVRLSPSRFPNRRSRTSTTRGMSHHKGRVERVRQGRSWLSLPFGLGKREPRDVELNVDLRLLSGRRPEAAKCIERPQRHVLDRQIRRLRLERAGSSAMPGSTRRTAR